MIQRLKHTLTVTTVVISIAVISTGGIDRFNLKLQRSIMRLVRDVSRVRARRRTQQEYALVPLLFGMDNPTTSLLEDLEGGGGGGAQSIDIIDYADLSRAKGQSEDDPLWIAVLGHVFDVREGTKFYGPGGHYEMLSGRDATKALATGDLSVAEDFALNEEGTVISSLSEGINSPHYDEDELAEAKRWLEYFAAHSKYKHVGRLPRDGDSLVDLDALVDLEIIETEKTDDNDTEQHYYFDEDEEDWDFEDDFLDDDDDERSQPPNWHPKVSLDDQSTCPGGGNK